MLHSSCNCFVTIAFVVCSHDFDTVLMACLDDGFHWLTYQIGEYFKPCASNGMTLA